MLKDKRSRMRSLLMLSVLVAVLLAPAGGRYTPNDCSSSGSTACGG